ncbi:hypothetical protein F5877DRAFT_37402 [Lentinula edodes]|nr:hypothetical protein F5877DRAFT_37402 [Lentinula edodes]
MGSPTDQAQQKDTLDGAPSGSNSLNLNPSFLNEAGGNSMGMVMAALQSLGSNTRASNPSDGEQQPAAHNEDPGAEQGQGQLREQIILEQFKLAQLKQLQEIQQQIFQQQMALLNSGTASLESQARDQTQRRFHGLPTPGSSTEIRPSQPIPVEFVSPMLLNFNDIDSRGSTVTGNNFASSPPFHATSNTGGGGHARAHDHYIAHRGTASAPAHIAFGNPYHSSQNGMNMHGGINAMNMSSEPSSPLHSELDFDISPLTSPWLGAKMTGNSNGNGRIQAYGHPQNQSQTHRNQNQMHSHLNTHAGLKRAASPTSISLSPNTMRPSASNSTSSSRSSRVSSSGSRSMNSTPLLRGINPNSNTRARRGSIKSNSPMTMAMTGGAGISSVTGFSSMPSNGDNSNIGFGVVGDSPSPVDLSLSMPPPAAPASAFTPSTSTRGTTLPEPLVPVTPASIMNLGNSFVGLGGGLGSVSQNHNSGISAGERKTSHKAAEQKRRDSLKTTFDDLRGLLPPIPLPTDGDSKSGGTAAVDDEIGFIALAKASLLPGALPPRGPPKVGEGPNKGVSKLQLLICGNEYIRVLKGRVERRDEEVERLRREVRRLRSKLIGGEAEEDSGSSGENENEGQEGCCYKDGGMLDLDRDLDAVEVLESMGTSSSGLSASMNGGGYLTGVDEDVEED